MKKAFAKANPSIVKAYEENMKTLKSAGISGAMIEDSQRLATEVVDEKVRTAIKFVDYVQAGGNVLVSPFINREGQQRITCEGSGLSYFLNVSEALGTENRSIAEEKIPEADMHGNLLEATRFDIPVVPTSIYRAPGLYIPEKKSQGEYEAIKKPTPQQLAEAITERTILRSYDCILHVLQVNPRRFKPLTGHLAQQFIDLQMRSLGRIVTPKEIEEIKKTLLYDSRIAVEEKVPLPPRYWPFWDGLVDIQTGSYVENTGEYFYTSNLSCAYAPEAKCPTFEAFVQSCTGGEPILEELIWETIGYVLSGDTKAKKFFVLIGPKDTGKSLLANIISALLGNESVQAIGINEVARPFAISELVDRKLAVCMDLGDEVINESAIGVIKAVTGGDLIRAEAKYKAGKTTAISARFLFGTNHRIRTKSLDLAFADRQIAIPFLYPVPKERQDKEMLEKIQTELPGIAVKAIKAYLRLVANNYIFPDANSLIPSKEEISHEQVVSDFITNCCEFSSEARVSTEKLYQEYTSFTMGKNLPALEKGKFSEIFHDLRPNLELKKIKFEKRALQGYVGVKLKSQCTECTLN